MALIEAFGHTDVGRRRAANEDSYLCLAFELGRSHCHLLAVADGMGGHAGGETASELAITTLRSSILEQFGHSDTVDPPTALERAFQAANQEILDAALREPALHGMGCTLVAAVLIEDCGWVANVGDSRAYQIHDGRLEAITTDHSWEADSAATLGLSSAEIAASPFRGMLTRALGTIPGLEVDLHSVTLRTGDHLLLCSDGAYREVSESQIGELVGAIRDPEGICFRLVEMANEHGGADNITCVVAHHMVPRPTLHDGQELAR